MITLITTHILYLSLYECITFPTYISGITKYHIFTSDNDSNMWMYPGFLSNLINIHYRIPTM